MDYGFVVPDNKYDTYRFRLDDSYDVTPRMEKLLHNKNLDHRKTFDLTMEGLVSEDLRDVRRIIVVDGEHSAMSHLGVGVANANQDLEVDSDYDSDAEEDFEDRCKANEPSYGRVELDFVGHLSATLEERQDDVYQDSYGGDECRPTVVENCREYKDALEKILDVTRDHLEERKENLWYFVEEEARY